MQTITTIGLDIAKSVFQVRPAWSASRPVPRRTIGHASSRRSAKFPAIRRGLPIADFCNKIDPKRTSVNFDPNWFVRSCRVFITYLKRQNVNIDSH